MSQKNLQLTRGQIITEGLGRAGRPDLLSEARLWLNLFLESQYLNQDYEWLLKYVQSRPLIEGDTIPADYVRMKTLDATPNRIPIKLVEADEFEARRANSNIAVAPTPTGTPRYAYIDEATNLIHFFPLPPTTPTALITYNYYYYYFPALPDPSDAATDSQVPMWGLSNDILIESIYVRTLNWNDDLRFKEEKDNVTKILNDSKMNSRDLRAGSPRFKLGKNFRRRF